MRTSFLVGLLAIVSTTAQGQQDGMQDHDALRDSVSAAIHRELADGLWANAIASGDLKGDISMDFLMNDRGRVRTVFTNTYTVSEQWKNIIQDYWVGQRLGFKRAGRPQEKVAIALSFP